jgi:SAM-dependent methyltransferase
MKNKWWEVSIEKLISILKRGSKEDKIQQAFDIKYGNYDYNEDLRFVTIRDFESKFIPTISSLKNQSKVLICGSNRGFEVPYLGGFTVTAIDISEKALAKLRATYPFVRAINANMNDLPFEEKSFDCYINMRSIQSFGVDVDQALSEAVRVTKDRGTMIISLPNGYMDDGRIIHGMWDSKKQKLVESKPLEKVNLIKDKLHSLGVSKYKIVEATSEIILVANK